MSIIKAEFKIKKLKLDHPDPELLLISRWQNRKTSSLWYLSYRWAWALYHMCWFLYTFITEEDAHISHFSNLFYYFIYLTNWGYMVLTVMTVTWAVLVTVAHVKMKRGGCRASRVVTSLKVLWAMKNICYTVAFLVTCIYWVALYKPGTPISTSNAVVHLMNSVYVMLELMASATPIQLLHIYQPFAFLCVYMLFTIVYYLAGGTTRDGSHYIYTVLDWEKPGQTMIFVAITLVFVLLLQILIWGIHLIRNKLYLYLNKEDDHQPSVSQTPQNSSPTRAQENPAFEESVEQV